MTNEQKLEISSEIRSKELGIDCNRIIVKNDADITFTLVSLIKMNMDDQDRWINELIKHTIACHDHRMDLMRLTIEVQELKDSLKVVTNQ